VYSFSSSPAGRSVALVHEPRTHGTRYPISKRGVSESDISFHGSCLWHDRPASGTSTVSFRFSPSTDRWWTSRMATRSETQAEPTRRRRGEPVNFLGGTNAGVRIAQTIHGWWRSDRHRLHRDHWLRWIAMSLRLCAFAFLLRWCAVFVPSGLRGCDGAMASRPWRLCGSFNSVSKHEL